MRTFLIVALATGCEVLTPPMAAPADPPATATSATRVTLEPDRGAPIDGIRVRVVLSAHVQPIRADVGKATLADGSPLRTLAASSSIMTLPIVIVEAESTRTVDLYFPLPAHAGPVAVDWPLSTSNGPYELRATLELDDDVSAEQPRDRWWFAPGYAWSTFRHGDGVITRELPRSASIRALDREHDCDRW